jgi:nicotinamidase-related amidase
VTQALVVVDIQNDYFPGGAHPLQGPQAAAEHARTLLGAFRGAGRPVFHIQHVWDEPDALYMRPGTPGIEINPAVAPGGDEPVIQKTFPNGFLQTDLEARLREQGIEQVLVCGMMTSMCVDATVRAAVDLGFTTSLAHDACATCDLEFQGSVIPAASVHGAFLAALADGYAEVKPTGDFVAGLAG